jgi:hypothetical protein
MKQKTTTNPFQLFIEKTEKIAKGKTKPSLRVAKI